MDGWTCGWMDVWMDGRVDGWADGRIRVIYLSIVLSLSWTRVHDVTLSMSERLIVNHRRRRCTSSFI